MSEGGSELKAFIENQNQKKEKICLELSLIKFMPITNNSTKVIMYSTSGIQVIYCMHDSNHQNREAIIRAFENDDNLELILNERNIIAGVAGSKQKCLPVEICK